jgi:ABC-type multidrug transport system fused ATPase/permease subunit
MRPLPIADPGTPDTRSAARFLFWLARNELRTLAGGVLLGVVWMGSQALMPIVLGRAIDAGIAAQDSSALAGWAAVLLGLGAVQAASGIARHRFAVSNFLSAAYRTVQLTVGQAAWLGATLPRRLATGDVVAIGTSDISHIGAALDITARGAGAVVALVAVAVILLNTSLPIGLVVVLGVPLLSMVVGLLIRPLHKRQQAYREQEGHLTTRAGDIVAGLRILRGVGGESVFSARYRAESQRLRAEGVRMAGVESLLRGAQMLLPGILLAVVTWLAARFALAGRLTAGQLVACYGYAVFLAEPLRTITEMVDKFTRAHVAARRVVRVLSLRPELADPDSSPARVGPEWSAGELVDTRSGLVVRPGLVTAIAAATPEDAVAIADRLGRYSDGDVTLSGVPLRELDRATVRAQILVAEHDARLFSGWLRAELTAGRPAHRGPATDRQIAAALHAASAEDVVAALPEGLDAMVADRGREFSGGQQQRLRLARALLADPPILVLVEPTSAVDAHTEAQIAARLPAGRRAVSAGAPRTTVIFTTSPLVLDRVDQVSYVEAGKVVATGAHRELMDSVPRYAATVTREEEDERVVEHR